MLGTVIELIGDIVGATGRAISATQNVIKIIRK